MNEYYNRYVADMNKYYLATYTHGDCEYLLKFICNAKGYVEEQQTFLQNVFSPIQEKYVGDQWCSSGGAGIRDQTPLDILTGRGSNIATYNKVSESRADILTKLRFVG